MYQFPCPSDPSSYVVQCNVYLVWSPEAKVALGKIKIRCYFTHMGVTRPHGKPGLGGKQVINSIWGLVEFSPSEPHGPVLMWTHQPQEGPEFTSPQLASCCCAFPPHSGHPLVSISSVILFCICLVLFGGLLSCVFIFHLSQPASVFGCTLQTLLLLVELLVSI